MIDRVLRKLILQRLDDYPAVVLLGPRQVGKTTLSFSISQELENTIYLDLESEEDIAKLHSAEMYLDSHRDKLVIIDEIQNKPELFAVLRSLIDKGKRLGLKTRRFLLLGSASLDLLQQSSESLAGRVSYLEMQPLAIKEVQDLNNLWLKGGFPDSYLASVDKSYQWRKDFIKTYLERDIPNLGPRIPAETLRRFWTMLAHQQGSLFNAAQLAKSLGVDAKTVARYLDLFVDLLLVRKLEPWHGNIKKRLVKSPKVYIRDTGILHALLGIKDYDSLMGNPILGDSWEGLIVENILNQTPDSMYCNFYRTSAGAEIDLLLEREDGEKVAVEVKRTLTPKTTRSLTVSCDDLNINTRYIVYPGSETYPLNEKTVALSANHLMKIWD